MNGKTQTGCIVQDGDGVRVSVHVVPRASKSEVVGLHGGALKVRLQAPPVDGKANKALCEFIAGKLGVAVREVVLVSGATSRDKVVKASGVDAAVATEKLGCKHTQDFIRQDGQN